MAVFPESLLHRSGIPGPVALEAPWLKHKGFSFNKRLGYFRNGKLSGVFSGTG